MLKASQTGRFFYGIKLEGKMKTITRDEILEKVQPLIIAGPCAVESKAQIKHLAKELTGMGVKVLRCQLWKPRTDKDSFQGVGLAGLKWLKEIKKEFGILIATEIVDKDHIEPLNGVIDILWVGARNMQNYELLKALEKDKRPVILKRGLIATVDEWIKAAKYIGHDRVILCERGIRTGADAMRFTLDLNGALVAKYDHNMPVIIDPSHTAGRSDMVPYLSYAGIAAGADGIVVEVHHQPEKALSDATQQITPKVFKEIISKVNAIYQLRHQKEFTVTHFGSINKFESSSLKRSFQASLMKQKTTKTLLFLAVSNRVGILKDILTVFADFDINLNKLESHSGKNENWDYSFEIEVESATNEPRLIQALKILRKLCLVTKILKEY